VLHVTPCSSCRSRNVCRYYAFLAEVYGDAATRIDYRREEFSGFPGKPRVHVDLEECPHYEEVVEE